MHINSRGASRWTMIIWTVLSCVCVSARAQPGSNAVVYRCPNNVYTDALSAKEAKELGCKTIEGAPITIVQMPKPRSDSRGASGPSGGASRPSEARVDPNEQRNRDSDKRRILETELKREEDALAALQAEYNKGEPERRGDEKNFQRYQERFAELRASIARKEGDIAAIKRELGKLNS